MDEVRFLAPLGVVSSNVPSSRLFAASPLSVSLLFRGLPRFLTLAVVCAMPSVFSATSPPLRTSIDLLTPTCPVFDIEVRFRGLPRFRILTVVVTSVVVVRASSPVRIFTWLRVTLPDAVRSFVNFGGLRVGLSPSFTLFSAGPCAIHAEEDGHAVISSQEEDPPMDWTAHFGGRPRRGRHSRASSGTNVVDRENEPQYRTPDKLE